MAETALNLPLLTEFDPKVSNDGSIDPLGLYPLSDALASELCPGVRERMKNPRFLTLMAIGGAVCSSFDEELMALDPMASPPYQVFEWFVVEGLVRRAKDTDTNLGLPGGLKARQAIREGVHLSAKRYLKTASVFGFFGIYRPLAKQIELIREGHRLGSFGADLVGIWEKENNLVGFLNGNTEEGARWRRELANAVEVGLKVGESDKSDRWSGWDFIHQYLQHKVMGSEESKAIFSQLIRTEPGSRKMLLEFLFSAQGQKVWTDSDFSEKTFHENFRKHTDRHLKQLLDAILCYERFARLTQNGFDESMRELCLGRCRMKESELAKLKGVKEAAELLPEAFQEAKAALHPLGLDTRFVDSFEVFATQHQPEQWVRVLFEHHQKTQTQKPPNGKKTWLNRIASTGEYIIDVNFAKTDRFQPHFDGRYVNFYRTASLWSFGNMLGLIK
jgi:hypothetical protein